MSPAKQTHVPLHSRHASGTLAFQVHTEKFAADPAAFNSAFVSAFTRLQENGHHTLKKVGV